MAYRRFSVTVTDTVYTNKNLSATIYVFVYDTLDEMYDAINRNIGYQEEWKNENGKTLAITQSGAIYDVNDDDSETYNSHYFYVRFVKDHIGTEVVTHESAHLALRVWEMWFGKRSVRMKNEEPFTHLLSYIASSIVDKFYEKGYYDN